MQKSETKAYLGFILLSEAVGALAGLLTREGTAEFASLPKSALTPPAIVFPIVWVILYALMGFAAARVYLSPDSAARSGGLAFFTFQLIVNFFWSIFFFNRQAYGLSLVWILLLLALLFIKLLFYWRVDRVAALSQLPYLFWGAFATYLTYTVWQLNG